MRFSTLVVSSVLAVLSVRAQNTTVAPVSSSVALTPAQSSQASCLSACDAKDPSCRQSCIIVPEGDYSAQNNTIACIDSCTQGDGTSAANAAYEACQKGCVASAATTPASTSAAKETGTATGTASETGTGSATGKATGTESASGSEKTATGTNAWGLVKGMIANCLIGGSTSTAASSSAAATSKAAADTVRMGVSLTGVLGIFAAILAL
ncbi:hypothetical protein LAWI1_G002969 [Lachnellula willkommii]|uniref:Uncharacterized protein n=1 Tax=Lachnellula willkommii TaxID=215461 RepID=A0A559MFH8_9HELO|nr:hypothetical protein LAWI1_G002969 [Lachnellula willkommii]